MPRIQGELGNLHNGSWAGAGGGYARLLAFEHLPTVEEGLRFLLPTPRQTHTKQTSINNSKTV